MPDQGSPILWTAFVLFILVMLALDLGVLNRKPHVPSFREALGWTALWASLASIFGGWLGWAYGQTPCLLFFTGYVIELSLSMDNVFVFIVILSSLKVPRELQHRVLFWGILTALILRGTMIIAGAALIERYHWILYLFGAFLIWIGWKQLFAKEHEGEPEPSPIMAFVRRRLRVGDFDGAKFLTRVDGKLVATPLMLALVMVEISDVAFAVDSIPAIFAVTRDPFIVFTANVFAILGLRSLFFVLDGLLGRFRYIKIGLGIVLVLVGLKLLVIEYFGIHIHPVVSLSVVLSVLGGSVAFSVFRRQHY